MIHLKRLLLFLAILLPLSLLTAVVLLRSSLPQRDGTQRLPALSKPVEVIFDTRGVPHIYAVTERDCAMALGYLHAQERIWQMDLMRRSVRGRLSEIFGPRAVPLDRRFRTLGLWHAAEADFMRLDPQILAILDSYAIGVNAYISELRTIRPPELLLLRYKPEPWSVLDSLMVVKLMCYRLSGNMEPELLRGMMMKRFGVERTLELMGGDAVYGPPIISPADLPRGGEPERERIPAGLRFLDPAQKAASNSFVVSGARSATGKPLLANDPHLAVELPGIWYAAHCSAGDLDVTGLTIPGLPLVVLGHNRRVAWGFTNLYGDCQDLYEEMIDPKDSRLYRVGQNWYRMQVDKELIGVRGAEPERVRERWTLHGPVVTPELSSYPATLALAWTAYHGGQAARAFYEMNRAKDFASFRYAVQAFDAPPQNIIYADTDGNIGYLASGKVPIRTAHSGLFPVPGWETQYQWGQFMSPRDRPHLYNPSKGYVVTANNRVIDDPRAVFSHEYESFFRAARIEKLIGAKEKHDVASLRAIQLDTGSTESELYRPLWEGRRNSAQGSEKEALKTLLAWNGMLDREHHSAAALYEEFRLRFMENALKDDLEELYDELIGWQGERYAGVLAILDKPDSAWWDDRRTEDVKESRDGILAKSLADAYDSLLSRYGPPARWDWTAVHTLRFAHVLGGPRALSSLFNRGPYPFPGDGETVNNSDFSFESGPAVTAIASCRFILDLSNWDASISVLPMGQSGHPLDDHYDDETDHFLKGEYLTMPFSRKAVEKQKESVLTFAR